MSNLNGAESSVVVYDEYARMKHIEELVANSPEIVWSKTLARIGGDISAGIVLTELTRVWIPDEAGETKFLIERDGRLWYPKPIVDWHTEFFVSPKQFRRVILRLEKAELVEARVFKFDGTPMHHIWLNVPELERRYEAHLMTKKSGFSLSAKQVMSQLMGS